jgi:tetratricopeptide (TPR) repeat protein
LDEDVILEAKKILNEKSPEELPEITTQADELDGYTEEVSELLKSAREKIENGKYASAENILIDAICKNSKCSWAYERLGFIYLAIGKNLSDAAESFVMATKLDQNNDKAWFGLGQIYYSQSQFNKATDAFSKAVNISRTDAEYLAALGKAYMEIRQYGKAAKSLKRAASLEISNQEYKKLASIAEDKHREHSRASKLS